MPLQKFIAGQKQRIEEFLAEESQKLLLVGVDPEAEVLLIRLFTAVDSNPRNRDVMAGFDQAFTAPEPFYEQALTKLKEEYDKVRTELEATGVQCDIPTSLPPGAEPVEQRFGQVLKQVRASLGERADHLVLVFGAIEGANVEGYRASLAALATALADTRVKLIAVDRRSPPLLAELEQSRDDVARLDFAISPETIEQGVKDKLSEPNNPPLQRMRYLATLAGFAMARKEFDTALALGKEVLEHFKKAGDPKEEAVAAFNLGNTYYRKGDYEPSRAHYEHAVSLALEHDMPHVAEQSLVNIGNTWFMTGELANALAYYEGALRWSKAISNPFGQAQALDLLGLVHQKEDRTAEARKAWEEALALYRGLDPALNQMAEAGEKQLVERLATLPAGIGTANQAVEGEARS